MDLDDSQRVSQRVWDAWGGKRGNSMDFKLTCLLSAFVTSATSFVSVSVCVCQLPAAATPWLLRYTLVQVLVPPPAVEFGMHSWEKRWLNPDLPWFNSTAKEWGRKNTSPMAGMICTLQLFNCEHLGPEQALNPGLSLLHTECASVCAWGGGSTHHFTRYSTMLHTTSGVWHTSPPELYDCLSLQVSSTVFLKPT